MEDEEAGTKRQGKRQKTKGKSGKAAADAAIPK
jgi:hypothetical protein